MILAGLPAPCKLRAHVAPISKSLRASLFSFHSTTFHISEFLYRKPSYRLRFWCLTISTYCRNRYVCFYGAQHQQLVERFRVVTNRRRFCNSSCPRDPPHWMSLQSPPRTHLSPWREASSRTSTSPPLQQLRQRCHGCSIWLTAFL